MEQFEESNYMAEKNINIKVNSKDLVANKYTLSISCNRFDENGELIIMNRNYDALIFEVVSDVKMVGYFKLDTKVGFKKM